MEPLCSHHRTSHVAEVAEELLYIAILLVDVRGRGDGVDAEFAAARVEDALDVHGLGVGLDGHVLGHLVHLPEVVEELVEPVHRLVLPPHEVDVRVAG